MFNIYSGNTLSNDNSNFSPIDILSNIKQESEGMPLFLVDDDQDDRYQTIATLNSSSNISNVFQFDCAKDLFKCFDSMGLYEEGAADSFSGIIMLDIHMPDLDGMKTLHYIRDHPMTAHMKVVLLSTDLSFEKIHEAYELQVDGYLEKPLNIDHFNKVFANESAKSF